MKKLEGLKTIVTVLLLIVLVALTLQIIKVIDIERKGSTKPNGLEEEQKKIKVGFSLGTLKEERWLKDRDILMAKIRELGGEIIVQNANNDDQDQLKQVRYLISQDIDVLILVPNDHHKANEAVELAKRNGVKVISYDRLVLNANVDLYVSFDNTRVGELMAESVLAHMPQGHLLIVNGATSDHNTRLIKEGYDRVLQESIEAGHIELVAEEWAQNWMKEHAFTVTDQLLKEGHTIEAVIAGNDGLADGVIEALSQHRLAGQTIVVGQDADLAACQRIVEGTQLLTIYKPIEKLVEATARIAVQMAKGEELANIKYTINDGSYDIPYYVLEPVVVDQNNMKETVIKDGFHMIDEVYRNLPNQ